MGVKGQMKPMIQKFHVFILIIKGNQSVALGELGKRINSLERGITSIHYSQGINETNIILTLGEELVESLCVWLAEEHGRVQENGVVIYPDGTLLWFKELIPA